MSKSLTLDKLDVLCNEASPRPWFLTTEEQAFPSIWLDQAKEKDVTTRDLNFIDAARATMPELIAIARAAILVHHYENSPLPNAQLLYEDAMFELGKAVQAWEAL